jgi:hypothetical protein
MLQLCIAGVLFQRQHHAKGSCGANQRCSTYLHTANSKTGIFQCLELYLLKAMGQLGLVNDGERLAIIVKVQRGEVLAID